MPTNVVVPRMSRFSVTKPPVRCASELVSPCNTCEVRDFAACAPLNPDEQRRLASIMTTVEIAPHQPIFDEADPAEHVYNVTGGAVKIYKLLPDGRRQITGFLLPGDFLGLTHKEAYAYSAEALGPTRLCRFPRRKLEGLLDEIPKLEQRLLGMASHELAAAQDQMMLLGRKSAKERVVSFLLMMSNGATRRGKPADPVTLPMNRSDIADYLGLTIETVSRTFTQLRTQKLIELLDEKQVRLLKHEALREIATGF
jgi:CRP/FNR family transcriptional regulator, anaerobic regulatory protein